MAVAPPESTGYMHASVSFAAPDLRHRPSRVTFGGLDSVEAELKKKRRAVESQQKIFTAIAGQQKYELSFRKAFVDTLAQQLACVGGWQINFAEGASAALICIEMPLKGSVHPVRIIDNAIPLSWCERFIEAHTAAGFVPQHIVDATIGSPQTLKIREVTRQHKNKQRSPRSDGDMGSYIPGRNTAEIFEVVSPQLADALFQRVREHLPELIHSKGSILNHTAKGTPFQLVGVIPRFRFMQYKPGQQFKPHRDPSRMLVEHPITGETGMFKSLVTIAMYLNDAEEYEGGGLHFVELVRNPNKEGPSLISQAMATVVPRRARCAIFEHDRLHESEIIKSGVKHMFQCDVLYEMVTTEER